MSFASEAKAELCRMNRRKKCCAVAEAYGVVLYCNSFTPREIRIITGSEEFASLLPKLFKRAFGVSFDSLPEAGGKPGGRKTLLMTDRDKIAEVFRAFGMEPEDTLSLHINLGVLENDCCKASFVRGAFLAGGSMTDPSKRYHLELATTHAAVGREMCALLGELGFEPGQAVRGASFLAYFKQSEAIADVLTTIGAPLAAMEVMNAKVEKNLMNGVNRRLNCDVANVDKAVQAAQGQIEAIHRLESRGELAKLPEKLQETARLRLEYPELSLAQLAEAAVPPVTKSCLNHRLRKLVELGKEC